VDYDKSPDTEFIEDGDWAVIRRLLTPSRVIDLFYDQLTAEQVDRVERPHNNRADSFLMYSDYDDYEDEKDRLVEVMQVFWKSMKKIGIATYIDEYGELQEREVDEKYKKEEGESVEWFWINEVWEGVRIDGDIYIKMRPYSVQRHSLDNPAICKLPINGRKYSDINAPNISMAMMGIPYQLTYNIYKYRLETAIAKSKDLIAMLDINMIPKGWEMDKFMYHVDATGIAWVDYNKEGVSLAPTHQTVLDMSMKTIGDFITLLEAIRQEWYDLAGMNRQRFGSVSQYDGKATTEQSIVQSSHITEDMFAKYSEFEQRELQALLDLSKLAWINGKKGMYVLSDLSQAYLDVDGIDHMEAEYGVFVSDDARVFEKIQMVQQLAQALVQNGTPLSAVIEVVEANSLSQIKDKIIKAEQSMQQLQQAQAQAEQAQSENQIQMEQMKMEHDSQEKALDRDNKIEIALIQASSQKYLADNNISSMGDPEAVQLEREKMAKEERLKNKELDLKKEIETKKVENDRLKAQAAMKSASRKPTGGK
jgi:hypothetical protein